MTDHICEHPDCTNYATHGICQPHIDLILTKDTVVEQCAVCGSLVAVFNKPEGIRQKYVWCITCRNCTGDKTTERKTYLDYPFSGRIIKGEKPT